MKPISDRKLIRSQLIEQIANKHPGLEISDVDHAVRTILAYMSRHLSQGGRIEIRGFGALSLHYRPARRTRNPRTGERLMTPPKSAVMYRASRMLLALVNNDR